MSRFPILRAVSNACGHWVSFGKEETVIFRGNLWNGNRVEDPGQTSEA